MVPQEIEDLVQSELYVEKRAFICFEGGGAKGLLHLAALYELEDWESGELQAKLNDGKIIPPMEIAGVSGTSIGAVVAALYAAGYTAEDFIAFDPCFYEKATRERGFLGQRRFAVETWFNQRVRRLRNICLTLIGRRRLAPLVRSTILERCAFQSPVEIFGPGGWFKIRLLRSAIRYPVRTIFIAALLFTVLLFLFHISSVFVALIQSGADLSMEHLIAPPDIQLWSASALASYLATFVALIVSVAFGLFVGVRSFLRGLCDPDHLADAINLALTLKLPEKDATGDSEAFPDGHGEKERDGRRLVRFQDVARNLPLRVIATDITGKGIVVYSDARTPCIPVGKAVAASAAMPLVFKPVTLEGAMLYDGGLVSNVSAWTFDAERDLDPDALTVSVETGIEKIRDAQGKDKPFSSFYWLIYATIFGAKSLQTRRTRRISLRFESDLGVLSFDASAVELARSFHGARASVRQQIVNYFETVRRRKMVCAVALQAVCERLREAGMDAVGAVSGENRIRVSLLVPAEGTSRGLKTISTLNYHSGDPIDHIDPDDKLLVPIQGSVSGEAFLRRRVIFLSRDPQDNSSPDYDGDLALEGAKNRHIRSLSWSKRKWCLAVPLNYGYKRRSYLDASNAAFAPQNILFIDSNIDLRDYEDYFSDHGWHETLSERLSDFAGGTLMSGQRPDKRDSGEEQGHE